MMNAKKLLAFTLAAGMTLGQFMSVSAEEASTEAATEAATEATGAEAPAEATDGKTLVVSNNHFEGKFSPFFAASAEDQDVVSRTFVNLMDLDRVGAPVLNGIEGETRTYNGTDYTYTGISDIAVTENEDGTA